MLDTNLEFRKGVLFIRLNGELTKKTTPILEDITCMILKNGIQNVVFNMEELSMIDMKGISALFYHYEICKKQRGTAYVCNMHEPMRTKMKKSRILQYMIEVENELEVLHAVAN